jgi:hypothetical protein
MTKIKLKAEPAKAAVEHFLSLRSELSHIKVQVRGNALTLTSADEDGTVYPLARMKRMSVHMWYLEMPTRSGWEPTFIEGTEEELMNVLVQQFPWALVFQEK